MAHIGRWAIQTAYEQGKPTGRLKIRPPFGPQGNVLRPVVDRANLLDRPHCLPEEITQSLQNEPMTCACFEVIDRPTRTHVELSWQVKLMGQPAAIGLRLEPDVPDIVVSCIEELHETAFSRPLGGECDVSLAFEFELWVLGHPLWGISQIGEVQAVADALVTLAYRRMEGHHPPHQGILTYSRAVQECDSTPPLAPNRNLGQPIGSRVSEGPESEVYPPRHRSVDRLLRRHRRLCIGIGHLYSPSL